MSGNGFNRKYGPNRHSTSRNPAVVNAIPANSSHRNSVPKFRGSGRVSHRRSQHFHTNQHTEVPVNNNVFVNRESIVSTNDYLLNVIQKETRFTSDDSFIEFSGQMGRKASFNGVKQIDELFGALAIRDNRGRKQEDNINFRGLELYPTEDDINRAGFPQLEPNKIKGAYHNVEHYLNVQFRLSREDFVASVRKGIQQFQNSPNSTQFKFDGIRIYPGTQFERIQSTKNNKLGILVNFDPNSKMRNFKWKESKRFMFGSLLLFTITDFKKFFFCTVVERDVDALKAGKILVSFPENVEQDPRFFQRSYMMAECEAFFDPYFLVMKLLRELDENTFPMTKYIVKGVVKSEYPAYVADFGVLKVFDRIISPITIDDEYWPTGDEMQLDQYQYRAFKAALTRDLCVIQGPPGTGKTFIGLKIVQNIWLNSKQFNLKLKLPILVVCSANHAVDQFLEGVLKFTKNVVRVGGQSRSEVMKKYNLRERARTEYKFFSDKSLIMNMKSRQRDINQIGLLRKCSEKPSGILTAKVLGDVAGKKYESLFRNNDSLVNWLLSGESLCKAYDERDFAKFKFQNEKKKVPVKKPEVDQFEEDEDEDGDEEEEKSCDPEPKTSYEFDDKSCYSISLQELSMKCIACIDRLDQLKKGGNKLGFGLKGGYESGNFYDKINRCKNEIIGYMLRFDILKKRLNSRVQNINHIQHQKLLDKDPESLNLDQRWLIYWHWTSQLVIALSKELKELRQSYSESVQQFEESRQQQDLEVMQKADVVGMTTSGAARLNALLKSLHPAVVVIEEAGEVLETHVIASLTKECQHVILIGDHEQLRPITAVYELSRTYKMNVSLFERLVKNGMDCPVLNVQHRMRPEISCLISPLIYKDLKNHKSVLSFESVRGVEKNVFFVDHNVYENTISDNSSKQNEHEATFIIHLAIYLIQQQYDPTKITILTTYSAQRISILNLLRQYSVDSHVKCVVVDKYQGEENDIVLLSWVRSNADGNIGFLDTKNRVCVALSRAKKGFFMIGNMSCLAKNASLWQHIRKTLTDNNAIGKALPLFCSIHGKRTLVASIDDFAQVKDGGCDEKCNQTLGCGHTCRSKCHYATGDHPKCCRTELRTMKPCGHELPLECSKEPKSENCTICSSNNSRGRSNMARNQVSCTRRSFGGSPTYPKHSYSIAPIIQPKRRSLFSRCCLL